MTKQSVGDIIRRKITNMKKFPTHSNEKEVLLGIALYTGLAVILFFIIGAVYVYYN
jgi:hypothetical protein